MSVRARLLTQVGNGDVTWRRHGRGITYKRWLNEHEYVVVTRHMKTLVEDGEVEREYAAGYPVGGVRFGPVVLTQQGRERLNPFSEGTKGCHAGSDGECSWSECPQLRDGEPKRSRRHCPLDMRDER